MADVEVADELLRDRRAALHRLAGLHVLHRGARDPDEVDAAVLVVAAVLDRDRGAAHPRADLVERDGLAVALGGDRAESRAVGRVDERVRVLEDGLEPAEVAASVHRLGLAEADSANGGEDAEEQDDEDSELATAAGLRTAALTTPIDRVRRRA